MKKKIVCILICMFVLFSLFLLPSAALDLDVLTYPSSNWMRYPYESYVSSDNGIVFTRMPDGRVSFRGTATSYLEFWLVAFYSIPSGPWSLSWGHSLPSGVSIAVNLDFSDNTHSTVRFTSGSSGFFNVPSNVTSVGIRYEIAGGSTLNFISAPMLNRGPTVYPFQPYLPKLIDDSFNEGKLAGIDESSSIDLFIEQASSVTFIFDIASSDSSLHPVTPQSFTFNQNQIRNAAWYSNGTINVSYLVHQEDLIDNSFYIKSFRLNVEWPDILNTTNYNFVLSGAFGGNISVGVSAQSGVFLPNHLVVRGYDPLRQSEYYQVPFASGVDFSYFSVNVVPPDGYTNINTIGGSFYASSLNDTLISFVANGTYSEGYAAGYYDALSSVDSSHLLDEAYSNGYNRGFSVGKNEGLSIAQEGTFLNLMTSVVDAPVSVFSQMFDFELLGVNMLTFAKSILTLCLCVAIVRFFV